MRFTRYNGAKNLHLANIIRGLDVTKYCEPFGGSFQSGLNLMSDGILVDYKYNDLDKELVNMWKCYQSDSGLFVKTVCGIIDSLSSYIYSPDDMLFHLTELYNTGDLFVKASVKYIIIQAKRLKQSFNFSMRSEDVKNVLENVMFLPIMVKSIEFSNLGYADFIDKHDSPTTFFFLDPPYYQWSSNSYYDIDCEYFYHKALMQKLRDVKGKWLLTYNDCDYIRTLYSNFNIYHRVKKMLSSVYGELYISNFDINEEDLISCW